MATNITGVSLTTPGSSPHNISAEDSFDMGGTITTAGGGTWNESGDMYFQWSTNGVDYNDLTGSGALSTQDTNPITGLQTETEQVITVDNDGTTGTFYIRVKLVEDDLEEHFSPAAPSTFSVVVAGPTALDAADPSSQADVGDADITPVRLVDADDPASTVQVTVPGFHRVKDLDANDLSSESAVDNQTLDSFKVVDAENVQSESDIANQSLQPIRLVDASDVISEPDITVAVVDKVVEATPLNAEDVSSSSDIQVGSAIEGNYWRFDYASDWTPEGALIEVATKGVVANEVDSATENTEPTLQPIRLVDANAVQATTEIVGATLEVADAATNVNANDLSCVTQVTEPTLDAVWLLERMSMLTIYHALPRLPNQRLTQFGYLMPMLLSRLPRLLVQPLTVCGYLMLTI